MPTKSKLRITTKSAARRISALHPGEMLREEFMKPLGLSANALAMSLGVPATRISEIVHERRGISAETALRLGRYFDMGAEFWMNVQKKYELDVARDTHEQAVIREVHPAVSRTAAVVAHR